MTSATSSDGRANDEVHNKRTSGKDGDLDGHVAGISKDSGSFLCGLAVNRRTTSSKRIYQSSSNPSLTTSDSDDDDLDEENRCASYSSKFDSEGETDCSADDDDGDEDDDDGGVEKEERARSWRSPNPSREANEELCVFRKIYVTKRY